MLNLLIGLRAKRVFNIIQDRAGGGGGGYGIIWRTVHGLGKVLVQRAGAEGQSPNDR